MEDLNVTNTDGDQNRFHTTHWSVILAARTEGAYERRAITNDLMARYWKPVYYYLRRQGHTDDVASDLTQGFFCEIVLDRELIQHADKARGRFRTLLLTALERYRVSVHRKKSRKKRQPEAGIQQLDTDKLSDLTAPQTEMEPEEVFYYAWVMDLLDLVLADVKEEYCSTERAGHWDAFWLKVAAPIVENAEVPSYTEICSKCGIEDESKAANMVITVKRRFRAILKRHLRNLVQSDPEVEDELNEVFAILSRSGAG